MNTKPTIIVVDDGTREYTLHNKFGKAIATVHFCPTDLNLMKRFETFLANDIEKIMEPLKSLTDTDGTDLDSVERDDKNWDTVNQVSNELYKRINLVFDTDEAEKIFEKRHPLSFFNGQLFVTFVLNAIWGVMQNAMAEESKKSAERMSEYLDDVEASDAGAAPAGA